MSVHTELATDARHAYELDQKISATEAQPPPEPCKQEVLSQIANIATIAALIGGFALNSLTTEKSIMTSNDTAQIASMLLFYLAVHACTCSAVACFWVSRK